MRLDKAFFHAVVAGTALLGARHPDGRIGHHLHGLRVFLHAERCADNALEGIDSLGVAGFGIEEQERDNLVTGIGSLAVGTGLLAVAVCELRRAVCKGFLGIFLENLLVDFDSFARGELATVDIFELALLDQSLRSSEITRIDSVVEIILGKGTYGKNGSCRKSDKFTEIFHTILTF